MGKDLYDDLGVSRDASDEDIKKAFKEKAKQTHPDKETGDEDEFKKVNDAYQVLRNPEKRKQYDETGETNFTKQTFESRLFQHLEQAVVVAIETCPLEMLAKYNMIEKIIEANRTHIDKFHKQIKGFNNNKKTIEAFQKRLSKKKDTGQDFIQMALKGRIHQIEFTIVKIKEEITFLEDVEKFLRNYEYEVDKQPEKKTWSRTTGSKTLDETISKLFENGDFGFDMGKQ